MKQVRSLGLMTASALALAALGAYACSSDSSPPPAGSSGSSGRIGDASSDREVPPGDDGGDAAVADGDAASALPLGDIPTVDEPDIPCVTSTGTKTVLFAPDAGPNGAPPVTRVQTLGARRFAAGPITQGFVTFDADGAAPKLFNVMLGTTETTFTSEGTTIGAISLSPGTVDYQRYDDQGVATGALVSVASGIAAGPSRSWVASGGGGTFAVWASGGTLFAAGINAAGALAGPPFTLATNASSPKLAITYSGDKFAIAYSYTTAGTKSAARFVVASATGLASAPVNVGTADALEPVAITPTSAGFLMVVDAGGDDHVYTVPLDATGKVSGPAHRLLGGDLPWGLASHAGDAALVTMTNDVKMGNQEGPRASQLRPLDITGKPTGPWVCFDGRINAGQYQDMGILAEASGGYSVVYKSVADTSVLIRVDKSGTKAP